MSPWRTSRGPRAAALLLLVLLTAATTACGGDDPPAGATATPTPVDAFGTGPVGTPGPGGATPTATAAATPNPPTYPASARKYAEAVLTAWRKGRLPRLADLTTPQVNEQILEIPGPPNHQWTYRDCDGAAGSSYCRFVNAVGDTIRLRITNSQLGAAHATTEVALDPTTYPADGVAYVKAFVAAWRDVNLPRMKALAVTSVVEYVRHGPAPDNPSYLSVGGGGGLSRIRVTNLEGFSLELHVGTTLLGSPDAIVGHAP
jgi:hypothetical protein